MRCFDEELKCSKWNSADSINKKPSLEVVYCNTPAVVFHLLLLVAADSNGGCSNEVA
jgi:hypothetical protein